MSVLFVNGGNNDVLLFVSSQFCFHWCNNINSLKSALTEVFTPQKWTNTLNQDGVFFLSSWRASVKFFQHITCFRPDVIYRYKLGFQFSLLSLSILLSCYPFMTHLLYTPFSPSFHPFFFISFPMCEWYLFPPAKDRFSPCSKKNPSNESLSLEFHDPQSKAPSLTPFCKIHIRGFGVDCNGSYVYT